MKAKDLIKILQEDPERIILLSSSGDNHRITLGADKVLYNKIEQKITLDNPNLPTDKTLKKAFRLFHDYDKKFWCPECGYPSYTSLGFCPYCDFGVATEKIMETKKYKGQACCPKCGELYYKNTTCNCIKLQTKKECYKNAKIDIWYLAKSDNNNISTPCIIKIPIIQGSVGKPGIDGKSPSLRRLYPNGDTSRRYLEIEGQKYCKTHQEALKYLAGKLGLNSVDDLVIIGQDSEYWDRQPERVCHDLSPEDFMQRLKQKFDNLIYNITYYQDNRITDKRTLKTTYQCGKLLSTISCNETSKLQETVYQSFLKSS